MASAALYWAEGTGIVVSSELLPPPANLVVSNSTVDPEENLDADWDAVVGADDYILAWDTQTFDPGDHAFSVISADTFEEVVNLNSGTQYFFRVAGRVDGVVQQWSDIQTATTEGPALVPATPANLQAIALSANSSLVTWNASSGATAYRLQFAQAATFPAGSGTQLLDANQTSFVHPSLTPLATYSYRVLAYNDAGDSPWSDVTAITLPETPPVQVELVLHATAVSNTEIFAGWNEVFGADTYRLFSGVEEFVPGGGNLIFQGDDLSFINMGLARGQTYYYIAEALAGTEHLAWSNLVQVRTVSTLVPYMPVPACTWVPDPDCECS